MKAKLRFLTFLSRCGDLGVWHLISTCMTIMVGGTGKIKMTSASSDAPNISKAPRRTPLNDLLCEVECTILIQDLEQRLRSQIEKIEHLKLFMAEALSSSSSSGGFKTKEHQCGDLKMSVAEHAAFLNDLNARTEALQTSISIFMQVNTTPKYWGERRVFKRRSVRPLLWDDTQSEADWCPAWQRRNSNASEMSCTW